MPLPVLPASITRKKVLVVLALGVACSVLFFGGLGLLYWAEESGWLVAGFEWLQNQGMWGNLIMALVFAPTSFPLVPGYIILTVACGFLFRFWGGLLTVIVGAQLGVFGVYFVVKYFLKERTTQYINKSGGKYSVAIMSEVAEKKAVITFVLRLMPLPIGLQNCILAVSPVPLWMYQVLSGLGLLVRQVPEVYLGSTLVDVAQIISGDEGFSFAELMPIFIGIGGVILFFILIFYISRRVTQRLKTIEDEELDAVVEEVEHDIDMQLEEIELPEENSVFSVSDDLVEIASAIKKADPPKAKQKIEIAIQDHELSDDEETDDTELDLKIQLRDKKKEPLVDDNKEAKEASSTPIENALVSEIDSEVVEPTR